MPINPLDHVIVTAEHELFARLDVALALMAIGASRAVIQTIITEARSDLSARLAVVQEALYLAQREAGHADATQN